MTTGMLFDCDDYVAQRIFVHFSLTPFKYDKCVGLLNGVNLTGAVFLHNYNGYHLEMSYYGPHTVTVGITRSIARYILSEFDPSRFTVITSKRNKHLIRGLQRLGFRLEGMQRRYYGVRDVNRNTGVRLVMFRDRIEQIAKLDNTKAA